MLEVKIAELARTKEELKTAKESVMQSWLDTRPLIDELEKQKSILVLAKNRSNTSNTVIPELESQLETINKCIRSKREDQLKAEMMVNELNLLVDRARSDMERLKLDIKKERQAQAKLGQILRLRRQTLQALQLTLQAVLLEADAMEESVATVLHQITHSETLTSVVQLTHEDYYALTRRADEKISQAEWRVSAATEQKLAAEANRELALSRLNKFYSSRSRRMNRRNTIEQSHTEMGAEKQNSSVKEGVPANKTKASPKAHAKLQSDGGKLLQSRSSRSNTIKLKKKPSILHQMKGCLEQNIRKLCG